MKWSGIAVIQPNVIHDLLDQIGHGVKNSAADSVADDHAQPDFHLVQPRCAVGREVELDMGMCFRPGFHRRGAVNRQAVEDHMDGVPSMPGPGP